MIIPTIAPLGASQANCVADPYDLILAKGQEALYEGVIECPNCGQDLEPDAECCGVCDWENPLVNHGFI
ncbi:MAG: hypothetical protein GYA24_23250 [Candidatus Lokiarchaeota archaeon]|nr:hypothetical protein [Candidatus Lokiarchaeota archaeon]